VSRRPPARDAEKAGSRGRYAAAEPGPDVDAMRERPARKGLRCVDGELDEK
jgi:hypothetical protein